MRWFIRCATQPKASPMRDYPALPTKDALDSASLFPLVATKLNYRLGDHLLIKELSLQINASGITMVIGPNGAGKSLLLRLLHGLLTPFSGRIEWGGLQAGLDVTRRQGMVFQKPVLLRRSVLANINFVLRARGSRSGCSGEEWLDRVGLAKQAKQPARLLSGGEQQRLALARALATNPEVLFLDEPTASLDPASVHALEAIVRDVAQSGTKVIFVSHDISQARRLADDVVFLNHGQVTEHQSASAFFETPKSEPACAYLDGRLLV